MWTEGNYRRNLLDMHIDDWHPDFLRQIDPEAYAEALSAAGFQAAVIKAKSHTGLCYWPASVGRMHKGLQGRDLVGETVDACHRRGLAAVLYYSQIFDNWAYETHPEWRLVALDGKTFREYRGMDWFRSGRYGICCPNNPGYREYVRHNLQELCQRYPAEGFFLDMTFWPEVCVCPSCRKRCLEETGADIPDWVDWASPAWRAFVHRRAQWLREFALASTEAIKAVRPEVTVEHQFSMIATSWVNAATEGLAEASDFCSGDYYGGYLQQSFINKYYRSVTKTLPFVYHTGRCDPELAFHTTTKTAEQLILHAVTALLHGGAFLLVDAINPDGTFVPEVYSRLMRGVWEATRPCEPFAGGRPLTDAAIWFASEAKYDPGEGPCVLTEKSFSPAYFAEAPVAMAGILREAHIPFDVIGSGQLESYQGQVICVCHTAEVSQAEAKALRAFAERGGSLYISGPLGCPDMAEWLGIRLTGQTEAAFTYMEPRRDGVLPGFSAVAPLTVPDRQYTAELTAPDAETLATLTLPYTLPGTAEFAAIHSNPPGQRTDSPCIVQRQLGKGRVLWCAAPLEMSRPAMSRAAVAHLIRSLLTRPPVFRAEAPRFVEVMAWEKDGQRYLALINEQEDSPVARVSGLWVELPGKLKAENALTGQAMQAEYIGGWTRIMIPELSLFLILALAEAAPSDA